MAVFDPEKAGKLTSVAQDISEKEMVSHDRLLLAGCGRLGTSSPGRKQSLASARFWP